jgi:serine/threonine protein kinase
MLHRDIKPDNLIIGNDGRVVLIDFGSARNYSDERTIAQTAFVTPGYAPLEQYNPTDRKGTFTDIYSIGATFYFMLTGEKPLNVTNRYNERLKAPHEINPNVSMQVSSAVMLAMEMKAEDRFQNVEDFRMALKLMKGSKNDGSKVETKVVSNPNVDKKTLENKNNILPKVIIGIVLVLLVAVVIIFSIPSSKSEICDCADTILAMVKEAKGNMTDKDKMEAIKNKYEAKIEKCEKMGEGKSEEDKKKMKEEMKKCPAYKEAEILMKEMMGGAEQ